MARRGPAHGHVLRWITVLLAAFLLTACGSSHSSGTVPRLAVAFARTPVPIALGSYCWQAGGHRQCADGGSIQSAVLARGLDAIRVLPGSPGQLTFDRNPSSLNLVAGPDEEHLKPLKVSGGAFLAPSTPGRYALRVSGHWPEGDANWVFVVTVTAT